MRAPQIMMAGKTQGGKTPLGDIFIGKGYAMAKDAYYYPYQTVRTPFTLMKHLGETSIPALFDNLPSDWLQQHRDDLKAYVQIGHFGDRGKSDQTVQEYRGRRLELLRRPRNVSDILALEHYSEQLYHESFR